MEKIMSSWKFIITVILAVGSVIYIEGRKAERTKIIEDSLMKMEYKVDTITDMVRNYQTNIQRIEKNQIEFGENLYFLQDSYKQYLKLREKDVETYSKLTDQLKSIDNEVKQRWHYNIDKIITPIK